MPAVAQLHGDARRQGAARAVAGEHDRQAVDVGIGQAAGDRRLRDRETILEGGGREMFRGEAVIDRDDGRPRLGREPGGDDVVAVERAEDEAAAVEIENQPGRRRRAAIEAERDLPPVGGEGAVFGDDAGGRGGVIRAAKAS